MTSRSGAHPAPAHYRVIDALNRDWAQTVDERHGEVLEWHARHPALRAYGDLAGLERRARTGCDEVLHALLAETRRGDALAARTVLQSMIGRMVRMAARDGRADVEEYVSTLWCVVVTYPLAHRPVRIAANLALDTLKAVHRDFDRRPRRRREAAVPDHELAPLLDRWHHRATLDHQDLSDVGAAEVLTAGRALSLIDVSAQRLLQMVYVEGLSGAEAAAAQGSSAGSVRVRCSRAVHRLAAHAPALAEAA